MRVSSAFSRLVRLPGVWVRDVRFEADRVVVEVALRHRRLHCPRCGYSTRSRRDTRPVLSVWRHLDLGVWRLEVCCRRRRLRCPRHGVLAEGVPFARYRSHFTRDFECLVAWLAARTDKTAICRLLRVDWDTVGRIIGRVCADELDPARLTDLFDIGIDEVSWKRQHHYLTLVADHRAGKIVWGTDGAGEKAADRFFAEFDRESPRAAPPTPPDDMTGPPRSARAGARERRRETPTFGEPVLVCDRVSLRYGAVTAVREVSLAARAGEIVCLVGDNGAGKSSVAKMISGAIRPTSGTISLNGEALPVGDPRGMRQAGIETVFQDLAVCTNLSAVHNLCLGDEPRRARWGWLGIRDDRQAGRRAVERLARLGVNLPDPHRSVQHLSGGQRQAVAIARVLKAGTHVVVLDEPTAALGVRQTGMVLDLVRSVADDGNAVVLISHDIETVLAIADRVVVLRRGAVVHDGPTSDLDESQLVHLMAGMGHLVGAAS